MKTYTYRVGILLMVFLAACSKSTSEPQEQETPLNVEADYTVLLEMNGSLKAKNIKASEDGLEIAGDEPSFPSFPVTEINYSVDGTSSFFDLTEDCHGQILTYDFNTGNHQLIDTFLNLDACSLEVTAIAHADTHVFISFIKTEVGKEDSFFVKIINTESAGESRVDVELDLRPLSLVPSNGKVFVLTIDDQITDENGLSVIDVSGQSIMYEKLIGFDAKKIFKDPEGNIIISYPELHTTLNSNTMAEVYTRYGETARPNIHTATNTVFDALGTLYYTMKTEEGAATESIPALYEFGSNKAVLYYFENFLTDTQLNIELNIHSATSIAFDQENNFILVGYKKNGAQNSGGILRLVPAPEFAYIDNFDLEGVPTAIYVE